MTLSLEIGYEQFLYLFYQLPPQQQQEFLESARKYMEGDLSASEFEKMCSAEPVKVR